MRQALCDMFIIPAFNKHNLIGRKDLQASQCSGTGAIYMAHAGLNWSYEEENGYKTMRELKSSHKRPFFKAVWSMP